MCFYFFLGPLRFLIWGTGLLQGPLFGLSNTTGTHRCSDQSIHHKNKNYENYEKVLPRDIGRRIPLHNFNNIPQLIYIWNKVQGIAME